MRPALVLTGLLAGVTLVPAAVILRSPAAAPQDEALPGTPIISSLPSSTSPTLVTSTAVVSGNTGTVVWQATTLSGYEGLRVATAITTTVATTSTASQASTTTVETGVETVVALVFAGGIAWWAASHFGAAEAISQIEPPGDKPDDSKDNDPACRLDPKETCTECGGRNSLGLCASGTKIGCPCDCPQQKASCKIETETEEDGCPCEPLPPLEPVEINTDPTEPPVPTDEEMKQAARDVLQDAWGGDVTTMPGYLLLKPTPPPVAAPGPIGDLSCYGSTGPGGDYGFNRDIGWFSLDHLCRANGPVYTSSPERENGFAGDRFWFDDGNNFCMSTAIQTPSGWWGHGDVCKGTGVRQVRLNVVFSEDQTGCEPKKEWSIPKTWDCANIFTRLLDDCDTNTRQSKNGGVFKQKTPNGCVDWRMWATPA
ncbi:hypothetical protein DL98DRAFT_587909 [Cadophora sp. DSE1049]|nr:hypothetical protein DL98DRAFT_587909 [Cadophora sp. DSE1049]